MTSTTTRTQFRDRVRFRLVRTDLTDDRVDEWLNAALLDLCTRRGQIRLLEGPASTPIPTQAGQANYTMPVEMFSIDYIEDTTSRRPLFRIAGGFFEWILAKQNSAQAAPTRFVERGGQFYLHPIPDAIYSLTLYGYLYPTWAADEGAAPSIEKEWDYGLELVACEHGARALDMDERALQLAGEFEDWLAKRDTNVKRTTRFNVPQRGLSPATASRRNYKTGV